MAEAIIKLVRDQDLAVRMGAEARQRVVTRFTAAQYAQAVQDIYRSMLVHGEADTESLSASAVAGLPG